MSAVKVSLKSISGPRGLLRSYILYRLSKERMSGYDFISDLDTLTGGSWHPGSGSIYPILEDLKRKRLIEVVSKGNRSKQVYALTARGKEALDDERKMLNQFAAKWSRIRLTLLDLVGAENLSTLLLESVKTNKIAWDRVLGSKEMSKSEVALRLKEYKFLLESEIQWVDARLRVLG